MKITKINAININAGWRVWTFVKVETSLQGLVGWSEVSESNGSVYALNAAIKELGKSIVGFDPLKINTIKKLLTFKTRQSSGSIIKKAISGIENACLDILAKDCGKSVMELYGGEYFEEIPIYWSHFGTTRVRAHNYVNKPSIKSFHDLELLCREVHDGNIKVVKTNIVLLDDPPVVLQPGFGKPSLATDNIFSGGNLAKFEGWISHLRAFLGDNVKIAVDINFNFDINTIRSLLHLLAKYHIEWLEMDSFDLSKLEKLKNSSNVNIVTGENILDLLLFDKIMNLESISGISVDPLWIGFSDAYSILGKSELSGVESYVHNFNGHLSTYISLQLGALIGNLRYLEYDIDDVPYREEIFTNIPKIDKGKIKVESGLLGWGTELIESRISKYEIAID